MVTVFFWLSIAAVPVVALSVANIPPDLEPSAAFAPVVFISTMGVAIVLCAFVVVRRVVATRRWAAALESAAPEIPPARREPTGFTTSCGLVGMLLTGGIGYLLLVPSESAGRGDHLPALLASAAAGLTAAALLALTDDHWNTIPATAAMLLISVALAAVGGVFLVGDPERLPATRLPGVLMASVNGLAVAAWLWCWLSRVWTQQLLNGMPWTTTGRMVPVARRFALTSAIAAAAMLIVATGWLVATAPPDDASAGRPPLGMATSIVLVGACVLCARMAYRRTFLLLAAISAVAVLLSFLIVR